MAATNRETVRDALATALSAVLVGSGKPAQALYGYRVSDFGGKSPVVVISSAGSARKKKTFQGIISTFYFDVFTFTLLADPDSSWTEANAEDARDAMEQIIANYVDNNPSTSNWHAIDYEDRTTADEVVDIGGVTYLREIIPLMVGVMG